MAFGSMRSSHIQHSSSSYSSSLFGILARFWLRFANHGLDIFYVIQHLSHQPCGFAIGQSLQPKMPWHLQKENSIGPKNTHTHHRLNFNTTYTDRDTEMKSTRLPDFQMILGTQCRPLRRRIQARGAAVPQHVAGRGGVRRGAAGNGMQRVIQLGLGLWQQTTLRLHLE